MKPNGSKTKKTKQKTLLKRNKKVSYFTLFMLKLSHRQLVIWRKCMQQRCYSKNNGHDWGQSGTQPERVLSFKSRRKALLEGSVSDAGAGEGRQHQRDSAASGQALFLPGNRALLSRAAKEETKLEKVKD